MELQQVCNADWHDGRPCFAPSSAPGCLVCGPLGTKFERVEPEGKSPSAAKNNICTFIRKWPRSSVFTMDEIAGHPGHLQQPLSPLQSRVFVFTHVCVQQQAMLLQGYFRALSPYSFYISLFSLKFYSVKKYVFHNHTQNLHMALEFNLKTCSVVFVHPMPICALVIKQSLMWKSVQQHRNFHFLFQMILTSTYYNDLMQ